MTPSFPGVKSTPGQRLALLAFAQLIVALDYNIVFVALPTIGERLGFSAQGLQWVVSAYVVAEGGFLLFGGRAADRLGARRIFMIGLLIYAVSSAIGGFATVPGVLVCARLAQGVGGALVFPASLRLIMTGFQEGEERNRAMTIWGAVGGIGLAVGALLGGVLTNYLTWRWVFFINVPLALLAVLVSPRILAADPPRHEREGIFDILGAVIVTAGASFVVFGLVGGPEYGWTSVRGAGALAIGAVLLIAFLLVEWRARDPLAPLSMFRYRSLTTAMATTFIYQGTLATVYYLFTTYMQDVHHYSPLAAGLGFLPPTLISMVAAVTITVPMLNKLGLRTTLFVGVLLTGIGIAVIAVGFSVSASYLTLLPGLAVWGIGGAFAFATLFVVASDGVPLAQQGVASALASTARQIGGGVGLAVFVAVANAGLHGHQNVAPAAEVHGLRMAGWTAAAVTVAGSLIVLILKKHVAPAPAAPEEAVHAAQKSEAAAGGEAGQ